MAAKTVCVTLLVFNKSECVVLLSAPTEYVIATTKLMNGSTWLQSLMTVLTPKPPNPF